MITEAADVHGAQASAITRTEGFYRPEVDILRDVGSLGVLALFCLAGVQSRNSSFRRRSIVHIPPLHSPMRSGTPSVNWDHSAAGNPSTTTPCCQINRARFSPSNAADVSFPIRKHLRGKAAVSFFSSYIRAARTQKLIIRRS